MNGLFVPPSRSWPTKIIAALRGIWLGVRGESSFALHLSAAALVVVMGVCLRVTVTEWCLLTLCITIVLAAETFNSALETLAKAIDDKPNPHLAVGLDIASGAVLLAAIGAVVTGIAIFLPPLAAVVGGW